MENALFVAFKGRPTQGEPVGGFNYLDGKFKFMDYHDLSPRYRPLETSGIVR